MSRSYPLEQPVSMTQGSPQCGRHVSGGCLGGWVVTSEPLSQPFRPYQTRRLNIATGIQLITGQSLAYSMSPKLQSRSLIYYPIQANIVIVTIGLLYRVVRLMLQQLVSKLCYKQKSLYSKWIVIFNQNYIICRHRIR